MTGTVHTCGELATTSGKYDGSISFILTRKISTRKNWLVRTEASRNKNDSDPPGSSAIWAFWPLDRSA